MARELSRPPRRVLLVEDDPGDVLLISQMLEPSGEVHLDHLSTLSTAHERLREQRYDAVLLDLMLPDAGRRDMLRQAARWAELVPIVALTGVHDPELEMACLQAGIQDYVQKGEVQGVELLRSLDHAITRHRVAELQRRMGALERQISLGRIASGVVHEFNNQATVVLENLEHTRARLDEVRKYLRDGGQALLDDLKQSVSENVALLGQISSIVGELRLFSSHGPTEPLEVVDLAVIVRRTLRLLHGRLSLRARVESDLTEDVQVFDYSTRLTQVVVNLLLNAFDAVEKGAPSEHRIGVRLRRQGCWALLTVEDSGCGIPGNHLDQVFEPFFTSKPPGSGTGLGLAICAEIVAASQGEISVESQLDCGTTFTVRLPLAAGVEQVAPVMAPALDAPIVRRRRARVLLIDDQPSARRAIARLLASHHDVVQVGGGKEALLRLRRDPSFDVIVCDLMMPDLDGSAVYRSSVERDGSLAERFLFLTGGAFTDQLRVFVEEVGRPVVPKPVTRSGLLAAVDAVWTAGSFTAVGVSTLPSH